MAPTTRPIAPVEAALIAQACSRSDVVWVKPELELRHRLVWHIWHDDAIGLVSGDGEQTLPPLSDTTEVIARSKDTAARVVTFVARAEALEAGSAEWESAAHALAGARLNHSDATESAAEQLARWRAGATIWLLRPVNVIEAVSGTEDSPDGRIPVLRGPGTTLTRRPFHLGRRQRRARRLGR